MSDCIEFHGWKNKFGYGRVCIQNRVFLAHRISHILFKGVIPYKKLVLHRCNNPSCINPDHLYVGTDKENAKDRGSAGRTARGDENGQSKLTWGKVREMRNLFRQGISYAEAGRRFGVSGNVAGRIARNTLWKEF